ncbi:MAG: metallophosphoesterase [Bacteroidota bacterium]|nr:metallophosphoesterase [Bacteroidota bacterium]
MKIKSFIFLFLFSISICDGQKSNQKSIIQFIFTSDAHYGIKRNTFRNSNGVEGHIVNAAMVKEMNLLSQVKLPADGGVNTDKIAGPVDFVIEGGDVANRMEVPIQSAAESWKQFDSDYIQGITLKDYYGKRTKVFVIPGNHDITNAIGFYRAMNPQVDPSSMVEIYNKMLKPLKPKTTKIYKYSRDKINYSKNIRGIHFMFINLWPDSSERIWMEKDLQFISSKTPVIIFAHDQPECEAKHFTNPDKTSGINAKDKFENLLDEVYKDGTTAVADGGNTDIEQQGWVSFLKKHPNIKAYFHGNSNYNEYYQYKGPDNNISLNTFRVDSPMKGKYSSKDETKLSFQLITINTKLLVMTIRECLWNSDPTHAGNSIKWGESKTISLLYK